MLFHGREDGFSRTSEEKSKIRTELLEMPFYQELSEDRHAIFQHRDYDEGGDDKMLIDSFQMPRGILSGIFVTRLKTTGNSNSDTLGFGNLEWTDGPDGRAGDTLYGIPIIDSESGKLNVDADGIFQVDVETISNNLIAGKAPARFIDYVNSISRNDAIDLHLQDDTMVDFAAFALCQQPQDTRGTTLVEMARKSSDSRLSWLSCAEDFRQASCNPFSGDHICRVAIPIACYKEGNRAKPANLDRLRIPEDAFVGGEVRMSRSVRPDSFNTQADANGFCAGEFGQGWRVLTYHEASGSRVVSFSDIAPRTRALIHVGDREYGNCWDRPKSVLRP